jgi:hypothetical protein
LGDLGERVLDGLGLVEDDEMPVLCEKHIAIAEEQRIGGEHQIGGSNVTEGAGPLRPVQGEQTQLRSEPCRLGAPVRPHAGRADHKARPIQPAGLFLHENVGESLHRLAQAHVVGKDAAQAVAVQELQPIQPRLLIGAEDRPEVRWRFDRFDPGETCEIAR